MKRIGNYGILRSCDNDRGVWFEFVKFNPAWDSLISWIFAIGSLRIIKWR